MDVANPYLIIPSETRSREFDAKLLTACCAVEAGYHVIVGSRREIHLAIDRLPRSTYIGKDLRSSSAVMTRILTRLGHRVVAWDEEALVYHTRRHYLAARVHGPVLRACDLLLAWGKDNAEVWRNAPHYNGTPIKLVGNPRMDLLRPELRAFHRTELDRIAGQFGRYILVNSNFGSVNHILPDAQATVLGRLQCDWASDFQRGLLRHRRALFERFLSALPALAESFPEKTIVVRPHPSEDPSPWQAIAQRHHNVHVNREGGVVPWLLGADAVVHNGCTTAVEGAIVGCRVISYAPIAPERYDIPLPNALSEPAGSVSELLDRLRAAPRDGNGSNTGALLRRHVVALDGSLASDRIVSAIDALGPSKGSGGLLGQMRGCVLARKRRRRKARTSEMADHKDGAAYSAHRFQPISVIEIERRIARFRECLGRFGHVGVRCLGPNVFELGQAP